MEDFVESQGIAFMAHLLKRLSDQFVQGCAEWFPEFGVTAPARTISTLRALEVNGPMSVTELAQTIRQSHPMVINWLKLLAPLGLIKTQTDQRDRRRSIVSLSKQGTREVQNIRLATSAIALAYERLMAEANAQIFEGLWRIEHRCREKSFAERLREARTILEQE